MTRLLSAGLAIGLFTFAAGCSGSDSQAKGPAAPLVVPEAPGIRVETASLALSSNNLDVSFPAKVLAIEDVSLAAPLGGYVESVSVKEGTKLNKGQILARIDSATLIARRDIAQAQAEQALEELTRAERLGKGLSKSQLLAAKTQAKVAKGNADLAAINARRSVIRAPFPGTVAEVHVEAGEVAPPGGSIVRVVRVNQVKLEVSVSDRDIALIDEGQEVLFRTQAYPEGVPGAVSRRGIAADSKSHTFNVEVILENPDRKLLPGMLGRVTFERQGAQDSIIIPQDWLVTRRDKTGVFLDVNGTATWRDVTVGGLTRDQAVISAGLAAQEKVVISGHRSLAEGDSLIVARTGQCCTNGRVKY